MWRLSSVITHVLEAENLLAGDIDCCWYRRNLQNKIRSCCNKSLLTTFIPGEQCNCKRLHSFVITRHTGWTIQMAYRHTSYAVHGHHLWKKRLQRCWFFFDSWSSSSCKSLFWKDQSYLQFCFSYIWAFLLQSGFDWVGMGWKSLSWVILWAPLCGANNQKVVCNKCN